MEDESHTPSAPFSDRPYVYEPMDPKAQQIRLMRVSKPEPGVIQCSLTTFSPEVRPPHVSLSYVWGPPKPLHRISVDDGYLDIRENLYNFLDEYCNEEHEEYIWIDQICINQEDIQERGHQVGLMAQVYSQAVYVVVWLGNDERYQEGALKLLADISKEAFVFASSLEENVYFERLWVVQEFLLAKEIHFMLHGNVWINWTSLKKTGGWVRALDQNSLLRISARTRYPPEISTYIHAFSWKKCQNPLDRVYGLLGLVGEQISIVPDYNKSTHELFLDVVNILVKDCVSTAWALPRQDKIRRFSSVEKAVDTLCEVLGFGNAQIVVQQLMREVYWQTELWHAELYYGRRSDANATISLQIGFGNTHMRGTPAETDDLPENRWWLDFNGRVIF